MNVPYSKALTCKHYSESVFSNMACRMPHLRLVTTKHGVKFIDAVIQLLHSRAGKMIYTGIINSITGVFALATLCVGITELIASTVPHCSDSNYSSDADLCSMVRNLALSAMGLDLTVIALILYQLIVLHDLARAHPFKALPFVLGITLAGQSVCMACLIAYLHQVCRTADPAVTHYAISLGAINALIFFILTPISTATTLCCVRRYLHERPLLDSLNM